MQGQPSIPNKKPHTFQVTSRGWKVAIICPEDSIYLGTDGPRIEVFSSQTICEMASTISIQVRGCCMRITTSTNKFINLECPGFYNRLMIIITYPPYGKSIDYNDYDLTGGGVATTLASNLESYNANAKVQRVLIVQTKWIRIFWLIYNETRYPVSINSILVRLLSSNEYLEPRVRPQFSTQNLTSQKLPWAYPRAASRTRSSGLRESWRKKIWNARDLGVLEVKRVFCNQQFQGTMLLTFLDLQGEFFAELEISTKNPSYFWFKYHCIWFTDNMLYPLVHVANGWGG